MSTEPALPFANNWAYLKTELNWLERLLMLAIARQRKETKEISRVARNQADHVSSHWWQGIINVSNRLYDETPPPPKAQSPTGVAPSYQQQMDDRIKATHEKGTHLALPSLKASLKLSLFEKNLILMTLAPEVSLRYGRLYHYLQTGADHSLGELPTVELILRLLCRNELERRQARNQLTGARSLIQRQVLQCITPPARTLLTSYLQLDKEWVNYLLAEQPCPTRLQALAAKALFSRPVSAPLATSLEPSLALSSETPLETLATPDCQVETATAVSRKIIALDSQVDWSQLILPASLKTQLKLLSQQLSGRSLGNFSEAQARPMALLLGAPGTGKRMAAAAIATTQDCPLHQVDLAEVAAADWPDLLQALNQIQAPILLIKSAHYWLGRHALIERAALHQWLHQRPPGLLLFSAHYRHTLRASWRQQISVELTFSVPSPGDREKLWRQAWGTQPPALSKQQWTTLAKTLQLTGGQIHTLAQNALALAAAEGQPRAKLQHLKQALSQQGYRLSG